MPLAGEVYVEAAQPTSPRGPDPPGSASVPMTLMISCRACGVDSALGLVEDERVACRIVDLQRTLVVAVADLHGGHAEGAKLGRDCLYVAHLDRRRHAGVGRALAR